MYGVLLLGLVFDMNMSSQTLSYMCQDVFPCSIPLHVGLPMHTHSGPNHKKI